MGPDSKCSHVRMLMIQSVACDTFRQELTALRGGCADGSSPQGFCLPYVWLRAHVVRRCRPPAAREMSLLECVSLEVCLTSLCGSHAGQAAVCCMLSLLPLPVLLCALCVALLSTSVLFVHVLIALPRALPPIRRWPKKGGQKLVLDFGPRGGYTDCLWTRSAGHFLARNPGSKTGPRVVLPASSFRRGPSLCLPAPSCMCSASLLLAAHTAPSLLLRVLRVHFPSSPFRTQRLAALPSLHLLLPLHACTGCGPW